MTTHEPHEMSSEMKSEASFHINLMDREEPEPEKHEEIPENSDYLDESLYMVKRKINLPNQPNQPNPAHEEPKEPNDEELNVCEDNLKINGIY